MSDIINPIVGGMFDSTEVVETPGGFPRGNKAVDSAFFAKMISSFYADGVLRDGGYSVEPAGGMTVTVTPGVAWAHGYMALSEDDTTVTLQAGKTYAVLIRLNSLLGEFNLIVTESLTGLPTRTSTICDLILAEITVPSGVSSVTSAMITDTRADTEKCGYVRNAIDELGEALHSEDSDKLGNSPAADFVKKTGAVMTGELHAAADTTGVSLVRNISYGSSVPASLASGEVFILVP